MKKVTAGAVNATVERISLGYAHGAVSYQNFETKDVLPPNLLHSSAVRCIRFSPDGRLMATGGDDTIVNVLDMSGGTGNQYRDAKGVITSIDVSDRGMVAAGSGDHNVRIHMLGSGKCVKTLPHDAGVSHVSLVPRGHMLATAGPDGVLLWDTGDWKNVRLVKDEAMKIVRFSKNGKLLATVSAGNRITVWDASNPFDVAHVKAVATRTQGESVNDVTFDFPGTRLGVCHDNGLDVWTHATGAILSPKISELRVRVLTMDFAADGSSLPIFIHR